MQGADAKKIVVIGSLNMDYVLQVPAMPQVGETILSQGLDLIPGGKGANQACTAGRLGGRAAMLGAVGQDEAGEVLCASLAAAGVDVSRVMRCPDRRTGAAFITVDQEGRNSITVHAGANGAVDEAYIQANEDLLRACDIVLLQLEIPLEAVVYAAKAAKGMGKTVILDPAPARGDLPRELLACASCLKPNEVELATLTGLPGAGQLPRQGAELLRAQGVGNVVVTLGDKGVFLLDSQGNAREFPALTGLKAVDSTAAGDSFTGALAVALAREKPLDQAIEFAVLVSGITVTRRGAQSSIPTLAEVEAFCQGRAASGPAGK